MVLNRLDVPHNMAKSGQVSASAITDSTVAKDTPQATTPLRRGSYDLPLVHSATAADGRIAAHISIAAGPGSAGAAASSSFSNPGSRLRAGVVKENAAQGATGATTTHSSSAFTSASAPTVALPAMMPQATQPVNRRTQGWRLAVDSRRSSSGKDNDHNGTNSSGSSDANSALTHSHFTTATAASSDAPSTHAQRSLIVPRSERPQLDSSAPVRPDTVPPSIMDTLSAATHSNDNRTMEGERELSKMRGNMRKSSVRFSPDTGSLMSVPLRRSGAAADAGAVAAPSSSVPSSVGATTTAVAAAYAAQSGKKDTTNFRQNMADFLTVMYGTESGEPRSVASTTPLTALRANAPQPTSVDALDSNHQQQNNSVNNANDSHSATATAASAATSSSTATAAAASQLSQRRGILSRNNLEAFKPATTSAATSSSSDAPKAAASSLLAHRIAPHPPALSTSMRAANQSHNHHNFTAGASILMPNALATGTDTNTSISSSNSHNDAGRSIDTLVNQLVRALTHKSSLRAALMNHGSAGGEEFRLLGAGGGNALMEASRETAASTATSADTNINARLNGHTHMNAPKPPGANTSTHSSTAATAATANTSLLQPATRANATMPGGVARAWNCEGSGMASHLRRDGSSRFGRNVSSQQVNTFVSQAMDSFFGVGPLRQCTMRSTKSVLSTVMEDQNFAQLISFQTYSRIDPNEADENAHAAMTMGTMSLLRPVHIGQQAMFQTRELGCAADAAAGVEEDVGRSLSLPAMALLRAPDVPDQPHKNINDSNNNNCDTVNVADSKHGVSCSRQSNSSGQNGAKGAIVYQAGDPLARDTRQCQDGGSGAAAAGNTNGATAAAPTLRSNASLMSLNSQRLGIHANKEDEDSWAEVDVHMTRGVPRLNNTPANLKDATGWAADRNSNTSAQTNIIARFGGAATESSQAVAASAAADLARKDSQLECFHQLPAATSLPPLQPTDEGNTKPTPDVAHAGRIAPAHSSTLRREEHDDSNRTSSIATSSIHVKELHAAKEEADVLTLAADMTTLESLVETEALKRSVVTAVERQLRGYIQAIHDEIVHHTM